VLVRDGFVLQTRRRRSERITATVQLCRLPISRTVTTRPDLTMLGVALNRKVVALAVAPYATSQLEVNATNTAAISASQTLASPLPRGRTPFIGAAS
jgi:hypothetical protein